jgi:hypothetical protein
MHAIEIANRTGLAVKAHTNSESMRDLEID